LAQRKITLWKCSYSKGSHVQLFFKELQPLDLVFSLKNTLSLQLLLGISIKLGTKKARSHCGDVHSVRGALCNYFIGDVAPGLSIFLEKYFVFATPPKPFGGF
jgi:hypothetical protein